MLRGLVFSSQWEPSRWMVVRGDAPTATTTPTSEGPALPVAMDLAGLVTAQADVGDTIRLQTPTGGVRAVVVAEVSTVPASNVDGAGGGRGEPEPAPALADAHVVVERDALAQLLGAQGRVDRITVTPVPGLGVDELTDRLFEVLPADLLLRSAADPDVAEARAVSAVSDGIVTVTWAVALVAALVAALLVANTLSIVAAQRSFEVALARCIGMSRQQVIGSFLVEATVIGTAAALLGLLLGLPLALLGAVPAPRQCSELLLTTPMVVTAVSSGWSRRSSQRSCRRWTRGWRPSLPWTRVVRQRPQRAPGGRPGAGAGAAHRPAVRMAGRAGPTPGGRAPWSPRCSCRCCW
jgi:hypothetical protein